MRKIIVLLLTLILFQYQIFGQEKEIEKLIGNELVGIPKLYRKSFLERINLYLENIKNHNSQEISQLLGNYFNNDQWKEHEYTTEEKKCVVNKLNRMEILEYKITDIAFSSRNSSQPFQKREWYVICQIKELIDKKVVERKCIFIAYRQNNEWYFRPEDIAIKRDKK